MNYDFSELIKYDFESIDIEVTDKNENLIKERIRYDELLPTDEEIAKYIYKSDGFIDNLRETWDECINSMAEEEINNYLNLNSIPNEDKLKLLSSDKMMYKAFENNKFDIPINIILKDLMKENKLKSIVNKIINNKIINYDTYINNLNIEKDETSKELIKSFLPLLKNDIYTDNINDDSKFENFKFPLYGNWYSSLSYDDVKSNLENIVKIIKEFIFYKKNKFSNRKKISNMVHIIKFDSVSLPPNTHDKTVDILDMTKVYNFGNELLRSSLITNSLLEWKAKLPYQYNNFSNIINKNIYEFVLKDLENWNSIFGKYEHFDNQRLGYELKYKDICDLNNNDTIEINSIISHYFYNEKFVIDFNIKLLKYYIQNNSENLNNGEKIEIEKFNKYIRPIIIRNSPFDNELDLEELLYGKYDDLLNFCFNEWHLFEENVNSKIKILQELLNEYMMNKDIEVTPMGLLIKSKEDNKNIPLNSLSSGEKKLIVIFMHCLFNEDVPIIIDEPEISLSIIWQENLLPDLLEKTNIKQVIVATHSSAVISNSSLDKYIIPLPNSIVDKGGNSNERSNQ